MSKFSVRLDEKHEEMLPFIMEQLNCKTKNGVIQLMIENWNRLVKSEAEATNRAAIAEGQRKSIIREVEAMMQCRSKIDMCEEVLSGYVKKESKKPL